MRRPVVEAFATPPVVTLALDLVSHGRGKMRRGWGPLPYRVGEVLPLGSLAAQQLAEIPCSVPARRPAIR
jgi:hypothetical protein